MKIYWKIKNQGKKHCQQTKPMMILSKRRKKKRMTTTREKKKRRFYNELFHKIHQASSKGGSEQTKPLQGRKVDAMLQILDSPDHCPPGLFDDMTFFDAFEERFCPGFGNDYVLPHGVHMYKVYFLFVRKAGPKLRDDPDFIRKIFLDVCRTSYACDRAETRMDHDTGRFVASHHGLSKLDVGCRDVFQYASDRLKDDAECIMATIGLDAVDFDGALCHASDRLLDDEDFLLQFQDECLESDYIGDLSEDIIDNFKEEESNSNMDERTRWTTKRTCVLENASDRLKDDQDFIRKICTKTEIVNYTSLSDRLQNDKAFIIELIQRWGDGMELQDFPERFRDDDDIVRECIRAWSECLQAIQSTQPTKLRLDLLAKKRSATESPLRFVSVRLRDDRQVVMSVVKSNPYQISHASQRLKADQEMALFLLESLRDYPANNERPCGLFGGIGRFDVWKLCGHFPRSFWVDVEFIVKASRRHPDVLNFVSSSLDNSRLMHGDDGPKLLAIALGGFATAMNVQDDASDFWVHRYDTSIMTSWSSFGTIASLDSCVTIF